MLHQPFWINAKYRHSSWITNRRTIGQASAYCNEKEGQSCLCINTRYIFMNRARWAISFLELDKTWNGKALQYRWWCCKTIAKESQPGNGTNEAGFCFCFCSLCIWINAQMQLLGQALQMHGTGPLWGQALQNAWDRPALGTGPWKCLGTHCLWKNVPTGKRGESTKTELFHGEYHGEMKLLVRCH